MKIASLLHFIDMGVKGVTLNSYITDQSFIISPTILNSTLYLSSTIERETTFLFPEVVGG